MEIQAQSELPAGEKARRIQQLMMRSFQNAPLRSSLPSAGEEHTVTYHKRKQEGEEDSKDILGCKHYARGCKVKAACCEKLFGCRRCHDEDISSHPIDR
jgi:CHY zinc finger